MSGHPPINLLEQMRSMSAALVAPSGTSEIRVFPDVLTRVAAYRHRIRQPCSSDRVKASVMEVSRWESRSFAGCVGTDGCTRGQPRMATSVSSAVAARHGCEGQLGAVAPRSALPPIGMTERNAV